MRQGVPGEAGRELLGGPPRRPPPAPAAQRRAMAAEQLMVLYEDDSVEVHYADGARLLLSPCGSEYLYEEALPATAHPLQPAESTRQRVPFVLSAYRVRGGLRPSGSGGRVKKKRSAGGGGSECPPRRPRSCALRTLPAPRAPIRTLFWNSSACAPLNGFGCLGKHVMLQFYFCFLV